MKKLTKALGLTAALAVMIPLTAYAATSSTTDSAKTNEGTKTDASAGKEFIKHVKEKVGDEFISQELLDLLKLDQKALKEKFSGGKTLAQIAEEQGVSRDQLKQALTDAFNKKLDENKKQFTDNLDKMVDGQLQGKLGGFGKGPGDKAVFFKKGADLSAIATLLGVSNDELKQSLSGGKSIADLAKEKGVDVQKLIDAETTSITDSINQAVKDGKITQELANKQIAEAATIAAKIINGDKLFIREKDGFDRKGVHTKKFEQTTSPSAENAS